jgi:2-iminobutanoate/2-iminopropanoate deaminase
MRREKSMKSMVKTEKAPAAIGPYSQAVLVGAGRMLFCSGQIPLDPATNEVVPGDIKEQTRRVMENLKAVITEAGFTMDDVVKTTVYLTDLSGFAGFNEIYGSYFPGDHPARVTVQAAGLPRGAKVEIDAILCGE